MKNRWKKRYTFLQLRLHFWTWWPLR
jgi:hypothetical protein